MRGIYSIIPSTDHSTPSPIDLDILSNLTKLTSFAKLTTLGYRTRGISYNSPSMACRSSRSAYSRIQLVRNHSALILSITDTILTAIDWADLTRILSSRNLNLVTLKVSGQHTPLSPVQWAVLRHNRALSPLVDDGRLILVNSSPT